MKTNYIHKSKTEIQQESNMFWEEKDLGFRKALKSIVKSLGKGKCLTYHLYMLLDNKVKMIE